MKFHINSADLISAINLAMAAATTVSKPDLCTCAFALRKGRAYLQVCSPDSYVQLRLNTTEIEGSGTAFFSADIVGLLTNRGEVILSFAEMLNISVVKGRYSAALDLQPKPTDYDTWVSTYTKTEAADVQLGEEVLAALRRGVNSTALKAVFEERAMLAYIDISKRGVTVSSWDNHHVGVFRNKVKTGAAFRVALLATYMSLIDRFSKDAVSITATESRIVARGEGFLVSLPGTQADADHFDTAVSFCDGLSDPAFSCEVDLGALRQTLSNLITLHKSNTYLAFSSSKKGLAVKFAGPSGSASDVVAATDMQGSLKAEVEPRLLNDILDRVSAYKTARMEAYDTSLVIRVGDDDGCSTVLACMMRQASE